MCRQWNKLTSLGIELEKKFPSQVKLIKYEDLINLDRFKNKSAMNLIDSINQSKKTTFPRFLFGLGIPNVGQHISKIMDKYCNSSLEKLFLFFKSMVY